VPGVKLEAVTVTGSKRDTSFLDSDLSVTVIDRQAAQQARIRDIRRIDDLAPNVQFNPLLSKTARPRHGRA
jgi:iron complex outermembrane receptor protein